MEGQKRQRCILHTTTAAKRPECGGQKTEKLRPRGVGPRVEVKNLQSIVKNCCQHFGRSNTAKVGEGVRRSAAQTVRAVRRRGVPRRVPEGGWPEGGGPKISRFLFLLPPPFSFFFSLSLGIFSCLFFSLRVSSRVFPPLSGGSSRGILVVFWSVGTSNVFVFALKLSCETPAACSKQQQNMAKTTQKSNKNSANIVEGQKRQGCVLHTTTTAKRPECGGEGGSKTEKLRPRGVGPRVEVKGLQSIVKNCCQHFGRSNTAKVVEGVRWSAAQKQQQEKQQRSRIGPLLANNFSLFGHDLVWLVFWPRPTLATTTLATTYFGHGLTDFGHGQLWAF